MNPTSVEEEKAQKKKRIKISPKLYYLAGAIFVISLGLLLFLSLYHPKGNEVYHKQASTIVNICKSTEYVTKPIKYNGKCLETDNITKDPYNLTIAFLADQSNDENNLKVLELIKKHNVDAIIHQGDFGYSSPEEWEKQINEVLGEEFPIFPAMGNHDYYRWGEYYSIFQARLEKLLKKENDLFCRGCLGVRSVCSYKGLWMYQTSDGVFNLRENELFFTNEFSKDDATYLESDVLKQELLCAKKRGYQWKICSWHSYTFSDIDFGGKTVEDNFRACIDSSSLIVNSHPHSFQRYYPLSSVASAYHEFPSSISRIINKKDITINATESTPIISPGFTMQLIAGLGGDTLENVKHKVDYGVLLCTFNPSHITMKDGKGKTEDIPVNHKDNIKLNFAACRFVSLDDEILDFFTLYLN